MNISGIPQLENIKQARKVISPYANRTPIFTSQTVNRLTDGEIFFKCENFQKVGAFKFRGACNAVMTLPKAKAEAGVATHSSGNHAQAVALSAKIRGIQAYIVMPENAPAVKIAAVKNYGAEIIFCKPTLEARETTLQEVVKKTGAEIIHPYNDARIISGQGTAALELLEEYSDLDLILAPVGGGGLLSGTALAAKGTNSEIKVIGCEPEAADDAYRSFQSGNIEPILSTQTIADGLRTALGPLTFAVIRQYVDEIVTVNEQAIIEAMHFLWERMKIIIEPSSAVPFAAVLTNKIDVKGKKVGIILTGGNVDLDHLPWNS